MAILLGENSYGESRVRVLRVGRQAGRHDVKELTLAVRFEGDFEAAQAKGENQEILPAETMRNTVHVLARQYPAETIEDFSLHVIEHFLTYNPQVSRVLIEAEENPWVRIPHGGKPHATAFTSTGGEKRTAVLSGTRKETTIRAGLKNLIALKTEKSAFEGFLRDPYTTLKEDATRLLCVAIHADWLYDGGEIEFGPAWHGVRQTLLETFAEHESRSLQHTLYAMGESILSTFDQIAEIHFSLSSKENALADLSPFGMDNPAEVFVLADEPHAVAEATLRRK